MHRFHQICLSLSYVGVLVSKDMLPLLSSNTDTESGHKVIYCNFVFELAYATATDTASLDLSIHLFMNLLPIS